MIPLHIGSSFHTGAAQGPAQNRARGLSLMPTVAYMSHITSFRKLLWHTCPTSPPSESSSSSSRWAARPQNLHGTVCLPQVLLSGVTVCSNPPMPAYSVSFTDKGNCRPERWNNLPKVTQLKRGGARSATWVYLDPKPPSFPLTSYKVPGRPWKRYRS